MTLGGALLTMSYCGADKVVNHYNITGPVKAALEATARYVLAELGEKGIRVYAVSPGPLKTRAASGIAEIRRTRGGGRRPQPRTSPGRYRVVAFLVGRGASGMSGDISCGGFDTGQREHHTGWHHGRRHAYMRHGLARLTTKLWHWLKRVTSGVILMVREVMRQFRNRKPAPIPGRSLPREPLKKRCV